MAVTLADIKFQLSVDGADFDVELQKLLTDAVPAVERYAPDAPVDAADRALILLVRFQFESREPLSQNPTSELVASRAAAVLAPYRVQRALPIGGTDTAAAPAAVQNDGIQPMRFGFSDSLPFSDNDFRWLGNVNGVVLDSTWTQPAAFGFWIPGDVMDRVIAFVAIEHAQGVDVALNDFNEAIPYRFGATLGMLRHTTLTFVGNFQQPNTFRAVVRT